jgi:hypothetical protein
MNKRNFRFREGVLHDSAYDRDKSDNRRVIVKRDINNVWVETIGYLHSNAIVKRNNEGLFVSYCGWSTRLTSASIRVCLPKGWSLSSKRVLHSPLGGHISLRDGWVKVEEPLDTYTNSWTKPGNTWLLAVE